MTNSLTSTKIKADREVLIERLKKAVKFITTPSVVPAMEDFLINVSNGTMEIVGQDSQCQVKVYCPVKATGDISICVPAKLFVKTIDLLRENEVLLTCKGNKVEIKCGKSKYNITISHEANEHPVMVMGNEGAFSTFSMSQKHMKMGIKLSEKFIDGDVKGIAANINGINVNLVDNRMVFTGLDGFNLGRFNISPLGVNSWNGNFVIPGDVTNKVASLLNDTDEVTVSHNGEKMIIYSNEEYHKFEVITTALVMKFPDTERLLSKRGVNCVEINTNEFRDAIMRLRLYTTKSDSDKRIIMTINEANPSEIHMRSVDRDMERDGEEVMTVVNKNSFLTIKGFNSDFLLSIISCIDTDNFLMYLSEDNRIPVFIQPAVYERENNFDFMTGTTSVD